MSMSTERLYDRIDLGLNTILFFACLACCTGSAELTLLLFGGYVVSVFTLIVVYAVKHYREEKK